MQETVDDLTAHQVATLAATQAAARALLDGLRPAQLEAEDAGGGLLPGAREKRLWEAYARRQRGDRTVRGRFRQRLRQGVRARL